MKGDNAGDDDEGEEEEEEEEEEEDAGNSGGQGQTIETRGSKALGVTQTFPPHSPSLSFTIHSPSLSFIQIHSCSDSVTRRLTRTQTRS